MHLPKPHIVFGECIAICLLSLPITDFVDVKHANLAGHADQRAQASQSVIQLSLCLERSMDQKPMHAQRMPQAQCQQHQDQRHFRG